MTRKNELGFIIDFVRENDFGYDVELKQLRSLWTAYCLHNNLECDTAQYDNDIKKIWFFMERNTNRPFGDIEEDYVIGFDCFYRYMCEEVV